MAVVLIRAATRTILRITFRRGWPGSAMMRCAPFIVTRPQRTQTLTVAVYALGDPWLLKAAIPSRLAASSTFVATPAIWDAFMGWMAASLVNMQTETCQRR